MNRIFGLLLLLAAALGLGSPALAQPAFPERGTAPVVDEANIIDETTEAELTRKLTEFEQRNQRQFVIATVPDLQGYDIAEYGYQLGRSWQLGDAENDDGIILLVAPNERQMRVEVGYGLEGIIPDGLAFEYVEGMKPFFREGDYSGGISWGADQIIRQLELPPEEAEQVAQASEQQRESKDSGFPIGGLIWLAFIVFFFILPMFSGRGRRRRYRRGPWGNAARDIILWEAGKAIARGLDSDHGGWGGGGGGFGGGGFGGFSGGGGSFGGGGASGGW